MHNYVHSVHMQSVNVCRYCKPDEKRMKKVQETLVFVSQPESFNYKVGTQGASKDVMKGWCLLLKAKCTALLIDDHEFKGKIVVTR